MTRASLKSQLTTSNSLGFFHSQCLVMCIDPQQSPDALWTAYLPLMTTIFYPLCKHCHEAHYRTLALNRRFAQILEICSSEHDHFHCGAEETGRGCSSSTLDAALVWPWALDGNRRTWSPLPAPPLSSSLPQKLERQQKHLLPVSMFTPKQNQLKHKSTTKRM